MLGDGMTERAVEDLTEDELRQELVQARYNVSYYRGIRDKVCQVLDEFLGSGEEDGSGQGTAGDVRLLGEQRDAAREIAARLQAVVDQLMRTTVSESDCQQCGGLNPNWSASPELQIAVLGSADGAGLCPVCFIHRAATRGIGRNGTWTLDTPASTLLKTMLGRS